MKDVCSEEHARRLKALHDRDPNFGVVGHLWADRVAAEMVAHDCDSILDYGCGRSNLVPAVVMSLHAMQRPCLKRQEYDPATAPGVPEPADYVTCIDVLEHVERDKIDAVLSHIHSLMMKRGLITISLRWGSKKKRATHPNVFMRDKWLTLLHKYFFCVEIMPLDPTKADSELAVLVEPIP